MNNLDPDVAERPDELIVYGGTGKAARSWDAFDAIVRSLKSLSHDETLLVQSGKPVGIFKTHAGAPRVLIANANLVPKWATWDTFRELEDRGLQAQPEAGIVLVRQQSASGPVLRPLGPPEHVHQACRQGTGALCRLPRHQREAAERRAAHELRARQQHDGSAVEVSVKGLRRHARLARVDDQRHALPLRRHQLVDVDRRIPQSL